MATWLLFQLKIPTFCVRDNRFLVKRRKYGSLASIKLTNSITSSQSLKDHYRRRQKFVFHSRFCFYPHATSFARTTTATTMPLLKFESSEKIEKVYFELLFNVSIQIYVTVRTKCIFIILVTFMTCFTSFSSYYKFYYIRTYV